jgi:Zn-dependent protease
MGWSWKIGTLFGIPVRLHLSMVLIPILAFGWVPGSGPAAVVTTAALVVLLFGSVLLHELGHALVARRFGVRTMDIILTPLGGMARVIDMPRNPRHEIAIAVAGPVVSLAIAGIALVSTILLAMAPIVPAVAFEGLGILMWVNTMLGLFNLVPALPMDGGRILRGLLALKYDFLKATRIAARIGRIIAVVGGVLAVFYFKSWSLAAIAVFVYFSAGMEERVAAWREARRQAATGWRGPVGQAGDRSQPRAATYTWTWTSRDGGPSGAGHPPQRRPGWRGRPTEPDNDVVVIEGGKAEVISRKDPTD